MIQASESHSIKYLQLDFLESYFCYFLEVFIQLDHRVHGKIHVCLIKLSHLLVHHKI